MVYDIGVCWLMNDEGHGMDRYLRWNRSGVMFLCASGETAGQIHGGGNAM